MSRPGLRLGHLVALAGASLLLASLWQPWYGVDLDGAFRSQLQAGAGSLPGPWAAFAHSVVSALPSSIAISGWDGMHAADVALCVLAVLVIALGVGATGALGAGISIDRGAAARGMSAIGALALLIAVEHILVRPGHGQALPSSLVELRRGVWMAVLGSVLMIVGGASASAPERPLEAPRFEGYQPAAGPSLGPAASVAPPGL